jgi:hypothetical protein
VDVLAIYVGPSKHEEDWKDKGSVRARAHARRKTLRKFSIAIALIEVLVIACLSS